MSYTVKHRQQLHINHGLRRWKDIAHARLMAEDAAKMRDYRERKAKMRAFRQRLKPDWRGFIERNRDAIVVLACCLIFIAVIC